MTKITPNRPVLIVALVQFVKLAPFVKLAQTTALTAALTLVPALGLDHQARAELKPVSDEEMSEVSGQAYISIDKHAHPDSEQNTSYVRVNLGLDIETLLNADVLELGRYERAGEKPGSSDVLVHDFGLGNIYDASYYQRNPDAVRPLKPDGSAYQNGEIVPFRIQDPFMEFAFDDASGALTGVRIGFGDAMGMLSGDIRSFSGNVNVNIVDHGDGLAAASSRSENILDQLVILLAPLLAANNPVQAQGQLVDTAGNLDPVRAEYIGIPNGGEFVLEDVNWLTRSALYFLGQQLNVLSSNLDVHGCSGLLCSFGSYDVDIIPNECAMLGVAVCFDLAQYRSFPIGAVEERNGNRYLSGPSPGAFISFQTRNLQWLKDVKEQNPDAEDFVRATTGAFFNIPNSSVQVNLEEALHGTERHRTEYIDRGRGLF